MEKLPIFVIQKHKSSHLHYDLRLEKEGILKSWAIPKEPPTKVGIKRLAVEVKDHPLDYADFQGNIPEGLYGAGSVKIWDKGFYVPIKFEEKEIVFKLKGKRLKGTYCLIKFEVKNLKNKNWLFFKKT
ncbi:MAG: hypothetical protein NC935_02535 [Candidatus Omnitrophica bacterium]|nr:hypothetical protein [Candidatus Omnitrophota bacterium]